MAKLLRSYLTWDGVADKKPSGTLERVSNWIDIQYKTNLNRRNPLWDYAVDGNGYRTHDVAFDRSTGVEVSYFRYKGKNYALGQFVKFDSPWNRNGYAYHDQYGNAKLLDGYDAENYYDPLLLELSDDCERVRLYRIVKNYEAEEETA